MSLNRSIRTITPSSSISTLSVARPRSIFRRYRGCTSFTRRAPRHRRPDSRCSASADTGDFDHVSVAVEVDVPGAGRDFLVCLGEIKGLFDDNLIVAVDLALVLSHRAPYRRVKNPR